MGFPTLTIGNIIPDRFSPLHCAEDRKKKKGKGKQRSIVPTTEFLFDKQNGFMSLLYPFHILVFHSSSATAYIEGIIN